MSGLTGRENFGHSLFIGAGAYTAGFLNVSFGLNPVVEPAGGAARRRRLQPRRSASRRCACAVPISRSPCCRGGAVMQSLTIIFSAVYRRRRTASTASTRSSIRPARLLLPRRPSSWRTAVLLKLLAHSRWGTILRAIRGDEASCQAAGINVTFYKIASLMISAAFAGLGGALYAALSAAGRRPTLRRDPLDQYHHHGLCRRHGHDLRARLRRLLLLNLLTGALRGLSEYRLWVYTLILIFILFFTPAGPVRPAVAAPSRMLRNDGASRRRAAQQALRRPRTP